MEGGGLPYICDGVVFFSIFVCFPLPFFNKKYIGPTDGVIIHSVSSRSKDKSD